MLKFFNALVSGITKKSLQMIERIKFVPSRFNLFYASLIHDLKMILRYFYTNVLQKKYFFFYLNTKFSCLGIRYIVNPSW